MDSGAQVDDGVGFQPRDRRTVGGTERAIDDAPVLHVGCEQAQWLGRRFRPRHGRAGHQFVVGPRDVTGLRGAREVLFARQRDQILELADVHE